MTLDPLYVYKLCCKEGISVKNVTVYRVDYVKNVREPIGVVVERRHRDRGNNVLGLLHVARKTFAASPQEALQIALDKKELFSY